MAIKLEKYLVISGVSGVFRLVSSRTNGVLVEDLQEKRTRFIAARPQQIVPLSAVALYTHTEEGALLLGDVFQRMLDAREQTPPPPADAPSQTLRDYFAQVLPEHDRDRVHIADIKKCVRWFHFMLQHGIFDHLQKEAADETPKPENAQPNPDETTA